MGRCPERQRGRTVNPLAQPSQVRVLPGPPLGLATALRRTIYRERPVILRLPGALVMAARVAILHSR